MNQPKSTKQKVLRTIASVAMIAAVFLAIYLPLKLTGALDQIDTPEDLKALILKGGNYSYAIFFALQFIQVTFLPVPAAVTTIAGTLVFGPWITFFLSIAAIMLGSAFAFFLGRKLGKRVVGWIVGEEDAEKWSSFLAKGKYVFFLMMLFPVFPDDVLCMVVGMSKMTWRFFLTTNLITRPIAILLITQFGSGQIIPFSGWGIVIWIALVAVMATLFFLSYKYREKIESFVVKLGTKLSRKNSATAQDESNNPPEG